MLDEGVVRRAQVHRVEQGRRFQQVSVVRAMQVGVWIQGDSLERLIHRGASLTLNGTWLGKVSIAITDRCPHGLVTLKDVVKTPKAQETIGSLKICWSNGRIVIAPIGVGIAWHHSLPILAPGDTRLDEILQTLSDTEGYDLGRFLGFQAPLR